MSILDRKIVHIGHMGVGGATGITPVGKAGNKIQQWVRERWDECKKEIGIPYKYPEILVFGGELIEGLNYKGKAEGIVTPRLDDQMIDAASCMMEWIGKETKRILILYSHNYHGSTETNIEDSVKDKLLVKLFERKISAEITVGNIITEDFYGKYLRFTHGSKQSTTNFAALHERKIRDNLIAAAEEKAIRIDCHYEYHSHRMSEGHKNVFVSLSCPCFKCLDRSGEFMNPDSWLPDIGVMVTTFEERLDMIKINNDVIGPFHPPFVFEEVERSSD